MLSAKLKVSNMKHGGGIRPNVFATQKLSCSFSDDRDTKHNEFIHYV